jgi:UDP-N-acetylglucosamine acyltransferase
VHARARLADDVIVEPGAVIAADVEIGQGTWVGAGAVIYGPTRMGEKNQVHASAVIGGPPQDVGYAGEPTRLEIGHRNVFREGVTAHRASTKGKGVTVIGNDNYFMAGAHIGHDCIIEDNVIFANDVLLAGHVHVQSRVNLAGGVALVQFVTVGRLAFVGGLAGSQKDVEPFLCHDFTKRGFDVMPLCVNDVGLRRAGFPPEVNAKLRTAFKVLFIRKHATTDLAQAREQIEARGGLCAEVEELLEFLARKRASPHGRQRTKATD